MVALVWEASLRVVWCREREKRVMVCEEIGFGDGEFEVKDIEELAFYPADVALAEDPGAERPVDVLEGGVVQVLKCEVSIEREMT